MKNGILARIFFSSSKSPYIKHVSSQFRVLFLLVTARMNQLECVRAVNFKTVAVLSLGSGSGSFTSSRKIGFRVPKMIVERGSPRYWEFRNSRYLQDRA